MFHPEFSFGPIVFPFWFRSLDPANFLDQDAIRILCAVTANIGFELMVFGCSIDQVQRIVSWRIVDGNAVAFSFGAKR